MSGYLDEDELHGEGSRRIAESVEDFRTRMRVEGAVARTLWIVGITACVAPWLWKVVSG
ncbi:MAG: hypothetical protein QOE05_2750 [Actinomycetota bacterium]|jgi:hypothetical protein|nr:hypothetical protein [Actinomycetota bacterium]